ncbi:MAG: DciA family protein [Nitrospirota bacterium]
MHRADSLLASFIEEQGLQEKVRLENIKKDWHKLFNKPLSLHMYPSVLTGGELLLNVDSHVWLNELNYCKGDIVRKLSCHGVRNVRLRLGRVRKAVMPGAQKKGLKDRALSADEISFIEEMTSFVQDERLRSVLQSAMGKTFRRSPLEKLSR